MKCPVCSNLLEAMTAGDVTVDVCKGGCGGIWFDNFELKKFDEPCESAGEALLDIERPQAGQKEGCDHVEQSSAGHATGQAGIERHPEKQKQALAGRHVGFQLGTPPGQNQRLAHRFQHFETFLVILFRRIDEFDFDVRSDAFDMALRISVKDEIDYKSRIEKVSGCLHQKGIENSVKRIRALRDG